MNVEEESPWGPHSLALTLPAVKIRFHGLSHNQSKQIRESYSGFVSGISKPANIDCHVYRLASTPGLCPDELTIDGQYAPKKARNNSAGYLAVSGINFEATFALGLSGKSSLGMVNEEELAYANVIENYLRIISAHRVLKQKGVVLHSAGLVFNDKAYVFCGRSNVGKTTLTRKACKKGAYVLSDDINLVLPGKTGYDAYAVPFTGEFGRTLEHAGSKESYPLAGIILLEQSDKLQTLPVRASNAVARLITGCPFVNTDEYESEALFDSVTGLVAKVPVIRLLNRRDSSFDDIMTAVIKQLSLEPLPSDDNRIEQ